MNPLQDRRLIKAHKKVFKQSGFFCRLLRVDFFCYKENRRKNGSFDGLFWSDVYFELRDNLFLCSYPIFLGRQTARIGSETCRKGDATGGAT
jgi:hypothetical protein